MRRKLLYKILSVSLAAVLAVGTVPVTTLAAASDLQDVYTEAESSEISEDSTEESIVETAVSEEESEYTEYTSAEEISTEVTDESSEPAELLTVEEVTTTTEAEELLTEYPDSEGIVGEPVSADGDEMSAVGGSAYYPEITFDVTYGQTEGRSMLASVNSFRTNNPWAYDRNGKKDYASYAGLGKLTYDYKLEKVAMQRAAEIAISFDHTRPNGDDCFSAYPDEFVYSRKGENIAAGQTSAESVFEAWCETNQPYSGQGHRRNMLGDYKSIGIGHVYYNGVNYWVQEFAGTIADSTKTAANDSQTRVSVPISESRVSSKSFSISTAEIKVNEDAKVKLPSGSITVTLVEGWPNAVSITSSIKPQWQLKSGGERYASIVSEGGNFYVKGIASGSTALIASAVGINRSIPLTVGCNHIYEKEIVPATLTTNGSVRMTCTKCGDVQNKVIYRPKTFTLSKNSIAWNGKILKPVVTVLDTKGNTIKDTHYDVVYKRGGEEVEEPTEPGTYSVGITFKGTNYTGETEVRYDIIPRSLNTTNVTIRFTERPVYVGSAVTPALEIVDSAAFNSEGTRGYTLAEGVDYALEWYNNTSAGKGAVEIIGQGRYSDVRSKAFVITAATFDYADIEVDGRSIDVDNRRLAEDKTFTAAAIKPVVDISIVDPLDADSRVQLVQGVDYKVAYKNTTKVAAYNKKDSSGKSIAPTIVVTGIGNYQSAGTKKITFAINRADISPADYNEIILPYTGAKQKIPVPVLNLNGVALKNNAHYVVSGYYKMHDDDAEGYAADHDYRVEANDYALDEKITKPIESGYYITLVSGKGGFAESTIAVPFQIADEGIIPVNKLKVILGDAQFAAEGALPSEVKILNKRDVILEGVDSIGMLDTPFNISISGNDAVGTAKVTITAKPDSGYIGSVTKTYKIKPVANIKKAVVQDFVAGKIYNGTKHTQDVRLILRGEEVDAENYDIEYVYPKGVNVGKVTMKIVGKADKGYAGTITKTFKVKPKAISEIDIADVSDYMYTGGAITPRPALSYTPEEAPMVGTMTLKSGIDFTYSYKNNIKRSTLKPASVIVTGKGNYAGTAKITFKIE